MTKGSSTLPKQEVNGRSVGIPALLEDKGVFV
jgi:hypothetical protein